MTNSSDRNMGESDEAGNPRAGRARAIERLRRIGFFEGISFLLLLGIAMPLKYIAGFPLAVKVVGWAHGVLFVMLLVSLYQAKKAGRWSVGHAAIVVVAALLPFGPFVIDRRLRREAAAS
jgi:integral membrane protein